MKKTAYLWQLALAALVALPFCPLAQSANGELRIQAQLVWGTNGGKPEDPKLKEVDQEVKEKLRDVFKWKDYFEVERERLVVKTSSSKRIKMSDKCEIEVHNLGNSSIEVKLYGEGKKVVNQTQKLKPGELLVLAGDDKNDTAWFVVLRLADK